MTHATHSVDAADLSETRRRALATHRACCLASASGQAARARLPRPRPQRYELRFVAAVIFNIWFLLDPLPVLQIYVQVGTLRHQLTSYALLGGRG